MSAGPIETAPSRAILLSRLLRKMTPGDDRLFFDGWQIQRFDAEHWRICADALGTVGAFESTLPQVLSTVLRTVLGSAVPAPPAAADLIPGEALAAALVDLLDSGQLVADVVHRDLVARGVTGGPVMHACACWERAARTMLGLIAGEIGEIGERGEPGAAVLTEVGHA